MRFGAFRSAALAVAVLMVGFSRADEGDSILYWMVDDTAKVTKEDGTKVGLGAYLSETATALGLDSPEFAARIRVTGGTPPCDTILPIIYPDGTLEDGTFGVAIGDTGSGYWGAGVPTGTQSPVGEYSAGTPEYVFIVEIGSVTWTQQGDDYEGSWLTVAEGASAAYSSLGEFTHATFDMDQESLAVWTPTEFTAVPEPSGAMLYIVGGALLMLRRSRFRRQRPADS